MHIIAGLDVQEGRSCVLKNASLSQLWDDVQLSHKAIIDSPTERVRGVAYSLLMALSIGLTYVDSGPSTSSSYAKPFSTCRHGLSGKR